MNVFEFGQLSFNAPYSEMNIIFSIASKEEYESLLDFVYDAARKSWCYCETDEFIQEQLKQIHIKPAAERGRKDILGLISLMNTKINIRLEEMQNICQVYEPHWNDEAYTFESDYNYFLFLWTTSA